MILYVTLLNALLALYALGAIAAFVAVRAINDEARACRIYQSVLFLGVIGVAQCYFEEKRAMAAELERETEPERLAAIQLRQQMWQT